MAFLQCVFTSVRIVCLSIQIQFHPMRWSKNLFDSALPLCLRSMTLMKLSIWILMHTNSLSSRWWFLVRLLIYMLLQLACFVIYCWLPNCLFGEAGLEFNFLEKNNTCVMQLRQHPSWHAGRCQNPRYLSNNQLWFLFFPIYFFFIFIWTFDQTYIQWDSVSTLSMATAFGIAVYRSPAYIHWSTRMDKNIYKHLFRIHIGLTDMMEEGHLNNSVLLAV